MSAHDIFFAVAKDILEVRNGIEVLGLAQAVCQFVLEEGGARGKCRRYGLDRRECPFRRRLQASEVLEGEKSAKSACEGL